MPKGTPDPACIGLNQKQYVLLEEPPKPNGLKCITKVKTVMKIIFGMKIDTFDF